MRNFIHLQDQDRMPKISKGGWLVLFAGVLYSACLFSFLIPGVARGVNETKYTYANMFDFVTQAIAEMLIWWVIRLKFKEEKLIRCIAQWFIDLCFSDLIYNIIGNPYQWEPPKLLMYSVSTGMFLIVYYFDYISKIKFFKHRRIRRK